MADVHIANGFGFGIPTLQVNGEEFQNWDIIVDEGEEFILGIPRARKMDTVHLVPRNEYDSPMKVSQVSRDEWRELSIEEFENKFLACKFSRNGNLVGG